MSRVNTSIDFLGYRLDNPFLLASGPATRNAEMIMRGFEAGWAGAITKTISLSPTKDPSPRLVLYPSKTKWSSFNIELISTDSPGQWVKWIKEIKSHYADKLLIASIMGSIKLADWQRLAKQVSDVGADMLELNISCPHGMPEQAMGEFIGQDPRLAARVTAAVKKVSPVPVLVKLTPNVTDIGLISRACAKAGADALSGINTVKSLAGVDIENLRPVPNVAGKSALGGYGGAAIKPIALRCVYEMAKASKLPVSGGGGIFSAEDAIEFMLLGATTVQICSAVMTKGFHIISGLRQGLSDYLKRKGFADVSQIIGLVNLNIVKHSSLKLQRKSVAIDYRKCIVRLLERSELQPTIPGSPSAVSDKGALQPRIPGSKSFLQLPEYNSLRSNCQRIFHCRHCVVVCRDAGLQAIVIKNNRPVVNRTRCDGCGLCIYACPHGAIRIK